MLIYILLFLELIIILSGFYFCIRLLYTVSTYKSSNKIPFTPTQNSIIKKILDENIIKEDHKVIDIGSGTGKVLFALAGKGINDLTGVEIRKELCLISNLKKLFKITIPQKIFNVKNNINIKLICDDARKIEIKEYDIIYLFSLPDFTKKHLLSKLANEVKKGAKVITVMFDLPDKEEKNSFVLERILEIPDKLIWKDRTLKVWVYTKR
jgi:SAM-dependent methyltransferase